MNPVRRQLPNHRLFGLISGKLKGNQHYYPINEDFLLYEDLRKFVLKTVGIVRVVKENLAGMANIRCMFIYGSFTKANAGLKKYIDLFFIGDIDENVLKPLVHESDQAFHHEITSTLMQSAEFGQPKRDDEPFVTNVITG